MDNQTLLDKYDVVFFGKPEDLSRVTDKAGRDVMELVSARDSNWFRTDPELVHSLTQKVDEDWIEIEANVPDGAKTMCVAFRLRNTLLNTVLLYDVMLTSENAGAIDWTGITLSNPFYALRLRNWYREHFGLKIQLWDGDEFKTKTFIRDAGPIAWRHVAAEISAPKTETAKLRFTFLPDNWVIDWIGLSFDSAPTFTVQEVTCEKITNLDGDNLDSIANLIDRRDKAYLVTYPGEGYLLTFDVGNQPDGVTRSYFLKSRGFYSEWIRHDWMVASAFPPGHEEFEMNDDALKRAATLWLEKGPEMERLFYEIKIPVTSGGGQ